MLGVAADELLGVSDGEAGGRAHEGQRRVMDRAVGRALGVAVALPRVAVAVAAPGKGVQQGCAWTSAAKACSKLRAGRREAVARAEGGAVGALVHGPRRVEVAVRRGVGHHVPHGEAGADRGRQRRRESVPLHRLPARRVADDRDQVCARADDGPRPPAQGTGPPARGPRGRAGAPSLGKSAVSESRLTKVSSTAYDETVRPLRRSEQRAHARQRRVWCHVHAAPSPLPYSCRWTRAAVRRW